MQGEGGSSFLEGAAILMLVTPSAGGDILLWVGMESDCWCFQGTCVGIASQCSSEPLIPASVSLCWPPPDTVCNFSSPWFAILLSSHVLSASPHSSPFCSFILSWEKVNHLAAYTSKLLFLAQHTFCADVISKSQSFLNPLFPPTTTTSNLDIIIFNTN